MQQLPYPHQGIALTVSTCQRKILVYTPEGQKFEKIIALGPNYRERCRFWADAKEDSVKLVIPDYEQVIPALEAIEEEVRASYADDVVNGLTRPELLQIMTLDGCFFLLLAFLILGAGKALNFPTNHVIFGIGCAHAYVNDLLGSMFFVGNQIPYIVIEKLMTLSYFQGLKTIVKGKGQQGLGRRTLHKFLTDDHNSKPMDLIHCLQSIMLGCGSNMAVSKKDDDIEIETVSKLSKGGVKFRKLEGGLGIRGMHYECKFLWAVLSLPNLNIDRYTGMLFNCLLKYELVQESLGFEPEACYFFSLLCELIRTPQDVEVLESAGIIQGEGLLEILKDLEGLVSYVNMLCVKREIVGNRPWKWQKHLKRVAYICATLTFFFPLMQMNYDILGYYKKEKS